MAFWGLSKKGKDAQGTMDEIARWNWDQAKKNWGRSNEEYDHALSMRPEIENAYRDFIGRGSNAPSLEDVQSAWMNANSGVRNASQSADIIDTATNELPREIWAAHDTSMQDIRDTANRADARLKTRMDFDNGTTSRAFAPAVARVNRSLRAAGIDPNSPEGMSMLTRIDTARGRAFDDNMAGAINEQNAVDRDRSARELNETDQRYDRTKDFFDQRRQNEITRQGLETNQAQRAKGDIAQLYQFGNNERQFGVTGLDRSMQGGFNRSGDWQNAGDASMQYANQGFGNTLAREQQNAGWGKKLLGGIAGAAVNAFVPAGKWGNFARGVVGTANRTPGIVQ